MTLLSPLSLFFLLFIPLLVLLYLLKIRRTDVFVPSISLWQKVAKDIQVQKPWQRLIISLLLFLQVAILALLSIMIAKPAITQNIAARNLILIMDTSASMAANDVLPSRLEYAKKKAIDMIDDLPGNSKVTLVACSNKTNIVSLSSNDHSSVINSIRQLTPSGSSTDLANALIVANGIARSTAKSEIVLLSDGAGQTQLDSDHPVEFIKAGKESDNVSIRSIDYKTPRTNPKQSELFVSVANNWDKDKALIVAVYSKDRKLVDAKEMSIGGGKAKNVNFLLSGSEEVSVRLQVNDKLKSDNEVWALNNTAKKPNITIYTNKNLFLEQVFKLFAENIRVLKPAKWAPEGSGSADILVFDGFMPGKIYGAANTLFINPPAGNESFSIEGNIGPSKVTSSDPASPLTANVDLSNVNILKGKKLQTGYMTDPIVEGNAGPLVSVGENKGSKFVVLPFDLHDSDLPLNYSFPIFIANIIDHFMRSEAELKSLSPGDIYRLNPIADKASVKNPSGAIQEFENSKSAYFDISESGIYEINYSKSNKKSSSEKISVAMVNSEESNIAPTDLRINSRSSKASSANNATDIFEEVWKPFAALALALVLTEWIAYLRGA